MSKTWMHVDPATGGLVGEYNGMVVQVSKEAWDQENATQLPPLLPPEYYAGQPFTLSQEYFECIEGIVTVEYWLEKGER